MRLVRFSIPVFSLGLALASLIAPAGSGLARGGYTSLYSDTTNFTGSGVTNGGAAVIGGNDITTLLADDIHAGAGLGGFAVNQVTFSAANSNGADVSTGIDLRIFAGDGAGGGPGTLLLGLNFNPITLGAGSVALFQYSSATSLFTMPSTTFWAGLTFTDSGGTTGATAAQLNNLGEGIFAPPTVGTSSDVFFASNNAGSFDGGNPAGGFFNFGGNPVADFGFAFATLSPVPEPSSLALSGVAGLALVGVRLARRRRAVADGELA